MTSGRQAAPEMGSSGSPLRFLLPRAPGWIAALALGSALAGLLEAAILIEIVGTGLAVIEGQDVVRFGEVSTSVNYALWTAGALAALLLIAHLVLGRAAAAMSGAALRRARGLILDSYAEATWHRQSTEREGAMQEATSTLAPRSSEYVLWTAETITAGIGLVVIIAASFLVDAAATLVIGTVGSLLFLALRPMGRFARRRSRAFLAANASFGESVAESTSLTKEFRVFGVLRSRVGYLDSLNRKVAAESSRLKFAQRTGGAIFRDLALLMLVGGVAALVVFPTVEMASLGSVLFLAVRGVAYAQQAHVALQYSNEFRPNAEALKNHVERLSCDQERTGISQLGSVGRVEVRDVSYSYAVDRQGLENVSFVLEHGEVVGMVGASGAGKSTLVEVLLRLRTPDSGAVLVSGIDYREIEPDRWARLTSLVPQEPRLVEATILENIRFYRPWIDAEAVRDAAARAHIADEIVSLPLGFETPLGPRGIGLSGGQRQRLALARALAGDPQLLVLDEPTSALDGRSEQLIGDTIDTLKGMVTVVVVAHRPSTLRSCDRLIVVDNGRVSADRSRAAALQRRLLHLARSGAQPNDPS